MIVSKNLLIEQCPNFKKVTTNNFIDACNKVGIEVEQVLTHPITKGLKVVKILAINKHPNADKLNLVQIDINGTKKQVVCGATNLLHNKYAVYAPSGVTLYNGIKLEKRNIRGIESDGMLCAYNELTNLGVENLSNIDKDGIILLDQKIKNEEIMQYLGLNDELYDLSLPSNRNDLNSNLCLLAELSYHLSLKYKLPFRFNNIKKSSSIKIKIDKKIVNDFSLIKIDNGNKLNLTWKQKIALMCCGYKIQNNILDFANYITILSGNPIHIYNNQNINGEINVCLNNKKQTLTMLDQKDYVIDRDLIICTNKKKEILSLPFIIGADKFKVIDDNNLLVEIANFNHLLTRKAMNSTKINTKSSNLGNKKIASYNTHLAYYLFIKYLNNKKIKFITNYVFSKDIPKRININFNDIQKFIGNKFDIKKIITALNQMPFIANEKNITIHPSRIDIENKYDIYEEVTKIIDINSLTPSPISFNILNFENNQFNCISVLHNFLLAHNFMEVKTYNLTSKENANAFDYLNLCSNIAIKNPISNVREYLKANSISQLLEVIQYNYSRKHDLYNIYEINKIQTSLDKSVDLINILFVKDFYNNKVNGSIIKNDLIDIKSFVREMLFDQDITFIHENNNIMIQKDNVNIGNILKLSKKSYKEFDLENYDNQIYAVLILLKDFSLYKNNQVKEVSMFPYVNRDYNISINNNKILVTDIINKIKCVDKVKDVKLVNKYVKEDVVTYTLSLVISDDSKTLNTNEINKIMEEVDKVTRN